MTNHPNDNALETADESVVEKADPNFSRPKSLIDLACATSPHASPTPDEKPVQESEQDKRDLVMSHKEARAGCPDDIAACGEEDTGSGLESLVTSL